MPKVCLALSVSLVIIRFVTFSTRCQLRRYLGSFVPSITVCQKRERYRPIAASRGNFCWFSTEPNIFPQRRFTVLSAAIGLIEMAAPPIFMLPSPRCWWLPVLSRSSGKEPELITAQDGHDKQDCENAAAKRWIKSHHRSATDSPVTLLGDDLYCNQPICETVLKSGYHFIFVCKRTSHEELYEWVDYLERVGEVKTLTTFPIRGRWRVSYHYRYVNRVPIRAAQPAMEVNWCEVTVTDTDQGKTIYHNAFATCHEISDQNVEELVVAGRARSKVENEGNNVLKTKGYHLEHNFGHGQKHLAGLLLCLNLLAFLFHTALDLINTTYQQVRTLLVTRKAFFNDLRALTRYLWFASWQQMFEFMLREGSEPALADSS